MTTDVIEEIRVEGQSSSNDTREYRFGIELNNPKHSALWFGEDRDTMAHRPLSQEQRKALIETGYWPPAVDLGDQLYQVRGADGQPVFSEVFVSCDRLTLFAAKELKDDDWLPIDDLVAKLIQRLYAGFEPPR